MKKGDGVFPFLGTLQMHNIGIQVVSGKQTPIFNDEHDIDIHMDVNFALYDGTCFRLASGQVMFFKRQAVRTATMPVSTSAYL